MVRRLVLSGVFFYKKRNLMKRAGPGPALAPYGPASGLSLFDLYILMEKALALEPPKTGPEMHDVIVLSGSISTIQEYNPIIGRKSQEA